MKVLALIGCYFLLVSELSAQTMAEKKIIVVSCKTGDLYIDGILIGAIEAEDARQHVLSLGEHYLQLKGPSERHSVTIKIDANSQEIIRLGCKVTTEAPKSSVLIDKQLNLGGSITKEVDQNAVALDEGDQILLNCSVLNKKGTASISIKDYPRGNEIFRSESFNTILNRKINIPIKGIYVIQVSTGALFGKDVKLNIERLPSEKSDPNFKTSVRRIHDTSNVEVLNTNARVYSITNDKPNKTSIKINLPINTTYWAYWIGVGQQAKEKMKSFVSSLSGATKFVSINPVVLFGLKLIPDLPVLNATSTISYRFMDTRNTGLFLADQPYSIYKFKYADNISADYSLVKDTPADIAISLSNNSTFTGQDVEIKVVAFVVKTRLAMEE